MGSQIGFIAFHIITIFLFVPPPTKTNQPFPISCCNVVLFCTHEYKNTNTFYNGTKYSNAFFHSPSSGLQQSAPVFLLDWYQQVHPVFERRRQVPVLCGLWYNADITVVCVYPFTMYMVLLISLRSTLILYVCEEWSWNAPYCSILSMAKLTIIHMCCRAQLYILLKIC